MDCSTLQIVVMTAAKILQLSNYCKSLNVSILTLLLFALQHQFDRTVKYSLKLCERTLSSFIWGCNARSPFIRYNDQNILHYDIVIIVDIMKNT